MKILIFSLAYEPFIGGAEVAVKQITDRLGGNHSFDLITVNLDGRQSVEEKIGAVNIFRLGSGKLSKYLFPWAAFKKAVVLHQEKGYDAIWAIMANQAGWAALKFKKKFPAVKYLLTLQEGDSEWAIWLRTFFIRPLYKNIYRRADYIQAISNFLAQRAKKLGATCSIEVVPNGVAIDEIDKTNHPKSPDLNQVITVSRLVKKNGLADLIEAIKILKTDYNRNVVLKVIGDGQLRSHLTEKIKKLGLADRVVLTGNIPYKEVYSHLHQADVFVRPSLSEGLGNAFLEAMACGVPVIGTPVGGIPDFLRDGETGWFCRVRDAKSIAEKINHILDEKNRDQVMAVVAQARNMISENYTWKFIAEKMDNIFFKLHGTNQ